MADNSEESPPASTTAPLLPMAFVWRRLHSLTGLGLVIFLAFHLYVNFLAALLPIDNGWSYIYSVNNLENTPLIFVLEILLLAIPFILHMILGVVYLLTAKSNSAATDGASVSLPEYSRNRAYTWQRITSWLLLFAIAAHVVHMRFWERPETVGGPKKHQYEINISPDSGVYPLAEMLDVKLQLLPDATPQLVATTNDFGAALLLMVRNSFKNIWICILYTILVLATTFHAFNGLWTFLLSWGIVILPRPQTLARKCCFVLMAAVTFLGLATIWGIYWYA